MRKLRFIPLLALMLLMSAVPVFADIAPGSFIPLFMVAYGLPAAVLIVVIAMIIRARRRDKR